MQCVEFHVQSKFLYANVFVYLTGLEVSVSTWQLLTLLLSMTLTGIHTMTSRLSPELIVLVRPIRQFLKYLCCDVKDVHVQNVLKLAALSLWYINLKDNVATFFVSEQYSTVQNFERCFTLGLLSRQDFMIFLSFSTNVELNACKIWCWDMSANIVTELWAQ